MPKRYAFSIRNRAGDQITMTGDTPDVAESAAWESFQRSPGIGGDEKLATGRGFCSGDHTNATREAARVAENNAQAGALHRTTRSYDGWGVEQDQTPLAIYGREIEGDDLVIFVHALENFSVQVGTGGASAKRFKLGRKQLSVRAHLLACEIADALGHEGDLSELLGQEKAVG